MADIYLAFQSDSSTATPVLNTHKTWNVILPLVNPPELVDELDANTGITFTRSGTVLDYKNVNAEADDATSGDASWVREASVINDTHGFNASNPVSVVLSGYPAGAERILEFYCGKSSGESGTVSVNGGAPVALAGTGIATMNLTETTQVSAVADAQGEISFLLENSKASYAHVNAARIYEMTGTDTAAPVFSSGPSVSATTPDGHTIGATINEPGTIYGVRLANGAPAPSSAQVKAGQDSTGAAAPEAKSGVADNSVSLVFSTGSVSTPYDYYIVAEDDEATPNLQASPTLVEATTSPTAVPGISAITAQKDGTAVQTSDWAINITLVSGGSEVYAGSSISSDASGTISAINATGGNVGDSVRVEGFSASNNYGFVFTQNLEDNA